MDQKFGSKTSPYQIAFAKRKDKIFPIDGPWINVGVIRFLENYRKSVSPTGWSECKDHDGLAIILPWLIQSSDSQHVSWSDLKQGAKILSTNEMSLQHYEVESSMINGYINLISQHRRRPRWAGDRESTHLVGRAFHHLGTLRAYLPCRACCPGSSAA